MALTYQEALKKAMLSAQGAGVDTTKIPIDTNYVKSLMNDTVSSYGQQAIQQGITNKEQGLNTVAVVGGNNVSRSDYDREKTMSNPLVQAISNQQPTTQTATPKTSNLSDMIKEQSQNQTNSVLSAIRQRIAESKANQEGLIKQAGQQYDPLRAESETRKAQDLISSLERSANMGDRGGIGRQDALATQTAGENRLNAINLQQQNFIDNANAEITRLENEGKYQEAQAIYDQKSKELDALMNESVRQEGLATSREAQIKDDFLNTITRFAGDYQAQINRVRSDGDTSNDWQIPYLETARQGKIGDIATGQAEQQNSVYKRALDKWQAGIPVNQEEAQMLGVRVGAVKPTKTSGGGTDATKPISDSFAISGLEEIANRYPMPKSTGLVGVFENANRERALQTEYQNYFQELANSGYPERELRLLAARYGIQIGGSEPIQDSSTRSTN